MTDTRRPLDALAITAMLVLSALWGFQQVAIKLAAPSISLVMQGALRSTIATALVFAWATAKRIPLFERDGTLLPGVLAGLLFASEFALIYAGLAYTTASRMVVFVYLAPALTALGLAIFVPGEKMGRLQWLGVSIAFAGIAFAFREGFDLDGHATTVGDALGVAAAVLWAATTVLIRATKLGRASATKTLLYQLGISAVVLPIVSLALGETGVIAWTTVAIASLAYQSIIVAFASFLTWFWLLTRYLASRLSVFSFATPLFGVAFGHVVLGEPITPTFLVAAGLVGVGIALVNFRR